MLLLLIGLLIGIIITLILNLISYTNVWIIILELLGFSIGTIILIIIVCVSTTFFVRKDKEIINPSKFYNVFTYLVFNLLLVFFRVKINVEGKEKIDLNNRYLVVANHQSNIDPFVLMKVLRKLKLSFIIKKELTNFFVFKSWAHAAGYYPLDRDNNRSAIKTIKLASEAVKVRSIAIFPEGTRSKNGIMLEFKDGAFKIAQKGNADVLVCMIDDVYKIKKRFPFRSTKVTVKICDVISKEEVSAYSTVEVSHKAYQIINDALNEKRNKKNY